MTEAITEGDYGLLNILLTDEEQQLNVGYLGRPKSTVYKVTKVINEEEVWVKEIGKDDCRRIPKRYFNKKALAKANTEGARKLVNTEKALKLISKAEDSFDCKILELSQYVKEGKETEVFISFAQCTFDSHNKVKKRECIERECIEQTAPHWKNKVCSDEYWKLYNTDDDLRKVYMRYCVLYFFRTPHERTREYFANDPFFLGAMRTSEENKKALAKAITPHKVEFSKESDLDKSERENLKRKISQLENENLHLKKQNTKSKTLIEGLRKENVRLNEKFLKTVLKEKLPTSVMNYITSFNKSVYENRLSVQFGFPPEEQWNGNFNAILKVSFDERLNEEWRRQQNFQLTYRLNAFEHKQKQLLPFDMGLTMNFQNWDIKWDLKTFEVMVVFQCDKNIKLLDTTKCEVRFLMLHNTKSLTCQLLEYIIEALAVPCNAPMQTYTTFHGKNRHRSKNNFQGDYDRHLFFKRDYKHLEYQNELYYDESEIKEWGDFTKFSTPWFMEEMNKEDIRKQKVYEFDFKLVNNKRLPLSKGADPVFVIS